MRLCQVRQLVASSIPCLRLDAVFLENDDVTETQRQLVLFGELLHTLLVERRSLQTLKLEGQQRQHLIAATCSLLPTVSCLQELEVVDVDDGEDAGWLSYALRHALRKHDLSQLNVWFGSQRLFKSKQALAVWKSQAPLRAVARKAVNSAAASLGQPRVRADAFKWFTTGTTFAHVYKATAEVFVNPAWVQRAWRPVKQGAELEVVVIVDSMDAVGVVVPGWGLCWIKTGAVCIETVARGSQTRELDAVKSLSVVFVPLELPMLLINWVVDGASLVSLSLRYWGSIKTPNNQLTPLLASCPNLESLSLEYCNIPSVGPLVRAYKSKLQPCRISLLTFACRAKSCSESNWWGLTPLADPEHPGAQFLRHLSVWLPSRHRTLVQQAARVLTVNRTLETVFVVGRRDAWARERHDCFHHTFASDFAELLWSQTTLSSAMQDALASHSTWSWNGDRSCCVQLSRRTKCLREFALFDGYVGAIAASRVCQRIKRELMLLTG